MKTRGAISPTTGAVGLIGGDSQLIESTRRAALELGVELLVLTAPHADTGGAITAGLILRPGQRAADFADDPAMARLVLHECGFDVTPIPDFVATDPPRRWHYNNAATGREPAADPHWVSQLQVVIARRPSGHRFVYPINETGDADRRHLDPPTSTVTSASTAELAVATAISIADGIDATGIISVRLLVASDKRLAVNSILLGPHCQPTGGPTVTSQFENHLRSILDLPLGTTTIATPTS